MDFSFSEEQTLLADSVQRFIQNDYSFEVRSKLLVTDEGFSQDTWRSFAELGWLALPFAEDVGGYGGTPIETMILMEEFGKGLVVEPYVSSILLSAYCLSVAGSQAQKEGPLAEILAGTRFAALAFVEGQARYNLADVKTAATSKSGGYVLSGHKGVVVGGPSAQSLIVPARTSGAQTDRSGITLFLVDADAKGVARRDYRTIDGHRSSEITFDKVALTEVDVIGEVGEGFSLLEQVIDHGILAVGAEAVGAMEVMYKSTVEYCQTREQFGQPIGKFQVLQHKMVDMFMEHEQTKSLLLMAAMRLDEGYDDEAKRALSALKVRVGKGGRFVGQSAIQLHGGMGMTDEMAVGHYFKRLTALDPMFGNSDFHLKRYAGIV